MVPSASSRCNFFHRKSFKHVPDDHGHFVGKLSLWFLLFLLCITITLFFFLAKSTLSFFFFHFICCLKFPNSCFIFVSLRIHIEKEISLQDNIDIPRNHSLSKMLKKKFGLLFNQFLPLSATFDAIVLLLYFCKHHMDYV